MIWPLAISQQSSRRALYADLAATSIFSSSILYRHQLNAFSISTQNISYILMESAPVVVVGAGPSGLVFGLCLAKFQIPVCLKFQQYQYQRIYQIDKD
jgi:hypothetical protein